MISVAEYPVKPVSMKGRYFQRRANANHQLSAIEIADLSLQSRQLSWDSYPYNGAAFDDLNVEKINRFIRKVNDVGRFTLPAEARPALEKLAMLHKELPTNAAMILFSKKDCATDLSWIENDFADAVLLMGPLYHLTHEEERNKAVAHAYRMIKPGGFVFAVMMSPYPKLNPLMESDVELLFDQNYINTVQLNGISEVIFKGYQIEQYRCWPSEAKSLMEKNGFTTQRMRNIEGVGELMSIKKRNIYSHSEKELLIETLRNTCENPNLLGITSQYLYVGKKCL